MRFFRKKPTVSVQIENEDEFRGWRVKAGMVIVSTEYDHDSQHLKLVVGKR